jgi:glycosyltransferase 2 family protein
LKKKLFSAAKLLFFLGIGVLFIWLFIGHLKEDERREIIESFRVANYWWIILAIVIAVISHIIRTLRWQMLLSPMGYHARFGNVFMAVMIGYLANLALPRLGEVSRCTVLLKYEKIPFQKSFGTVIAERAFDIVTFIVLFFINLAIQYGRISSYVTNEIYNPLAEKFTFIGKGYILYSCIAGIILLVILFFAFRSRLRKIRLYTKIANVVRGFIDGLKSLIKVRNPFLFLVYTVLLWFMYFLMTYICFFCIQEIGGLGVSAGFSVLILGTIGIMVVQGGIGIYPAIVAETLALYGASKIAAYALGWLIWTAQTVTLVIAGIISLILLPIINRENNGKNGDPEKKAIRP